MSANTQVRENELGSIEALWKFEERAFLLMKKYAGNFLYVRMIDNKPFGFVGPSDPAYVHVIYDRHEKASVNSVDDWLVRARI